MDLRRIRELLLDRGRSPSLSKLPEPGTGVCETPRGNLNAKVVQCAPNSFLVVF
jgi:hypothetical protein